MGTPFGIDDNPQVIYIFYSCGIYNPGWRNRLYIHIYLCAYICMCVYINYIILWTHTKYQISLTSSCLFHEWIKNQQPGTSNLFSWEGMGNLSIFTEKILFDKLNKTQLLILYNCYKLNLNALNNGKASLIYVATVLPCVSTDMVLFVQGPQTG